MTNDSTSYESIFVARQPVFTPDETIWGYELLFRNSELNTALVTDPNQATSSVIADGLAMAVEGIPEDKRILINFTQELLIDDAGFALPKERCIIEILENVTPTPETLAAVKRLKDAGYTIALDDYFGQEELLPLLQLADIIKIDVLELLADPAKVAGTIKDIPRNNVKLLAEKVENFQLFNTLKHMGFDLFQGFFFSKPEVIPGKKLSTNEMTKLQLLGELSSVDFDPKRLAEILEADPNLSYRLFRYINSVGFGLQQKVNSIKRAIDMMGMLQCKQWLRSAILADLNPSPKAGELAYMAVHRARFLETCCEHSNMNSCQPDTLFITGLFSLLDAMLGVDMPKILSSLPLNDDVVETLTGENKLRELLQLAQSFERGDWDETALILKQLGMDPNKAHDMYVASRMWAQQMVGVCNMPIE